MQHQATNPNRLRKQGHTRSEPLQMAKEVPARVLAEIGRAYTDWLRAAALADAANTPEAGRAARANLRHLEALRCRYAAFLEPGHIPVDPEPREDREAALESWVNDRAAECAALHRLDCLGWPDEATDADLEHDEDLADLDQWMEENQ